MITIDTHIHSNFSHGRATVQEMYEAARDKGMKIFGFSEHSPRPCGFDYPKDYKEKLTAAMPQYIKEVTALKNNADGINVLLGIEMDWLNGQEDFIRSNLEAYDYDYVIAGIHYLCEWGFDFTPDDWKNRTEIEKFDLYRQFYETMICMSMSGLYDIVAHPDIIKIFTVETFTKWIRRDDARELVRTALASIKEAGMAMEISSAGLRKVCKEIYPGPYLMETARDLHLPISFGSDAHSTASVGYAFDQLEAYAKQYGYTESVYFEKREMKARPF